MSDRAQGRPTEMDRYRLYTCIPTVSSRLSLHCEEYITDNVMRPRTDSGFMSTSSIPVGEHGGEYLERGSFCLPRELGRSRTGYAHNTNCQLKYAAVADGMGQPRDTGAEGGSRKILARGRGEVTQMASLGYPEFKGPCARDDSGFHSEMQQPALRFSSESNSRRSYTSTPSLFTRNTERSGSYATALSQADSPRFARSERNISRYAFGGERRLGSDNSASTGEAGSGKIVRTESMDSALCLDNPCMTEMESLHSILSVSSNPILSLQASEKDACRVRGPVENDGHIQYATAVTPASHPTRVIPGVGTDHAVAPRGHAPSPDVLLIRGILGVASICMPLPVSRKESPVNPVSSSDDSPPQPVEMQPRQGDSGIMRGYHRSLPVDFPRYCSLEKDDFLKAFDTMCREARKAGIDVVGRVIQISNFAAAKLDSRGGRLSIDALDVHLYVPPGAISDGRDELVYIFVRGNLDSSMSSLTPNVHCGPSTLRFEKDVILTFPHCAVDAGNYRFTCNKSMSGGYHRRIQEGEHGVVQVDTNSITLTMDHFCGYSADASVRAKNMMVCAFINEDLELGKARIRVRLFDDSEANLQEVEKQERRYRFHLADMVGKMVIHRGQDVLATLSPDEKSWKVTDPESGQRTLKHSILWTVPASAFAMFFTCCDSLRSRPFTACMKVVQKGDEDHGADFFVQMPLQHDIPPTNKACNVPCPSDEHIRQVAYAMLSQLHLTVPARTDVMPLAKGIYLRLCDVLDTPQPIAFDWRSFPECLPGMDGYGGRWIRNVEWRAGNERRSPTGLVLDIFFAKSKASGKGQARVLQDLMQGLLGLERQDVQFAIDAIKEQLSPKRVDSVEITAGSERDRDCNNNMGRSHRSVAGLERGCKPEQCGPSRGPTSAHQPPSNKAVSAAMSVPDFKAQRYSPGKDSAYSSFRTDTNEQDL